MAGVVPTPLIRPLESPALPWVVLLVGLVLSGVAWYSVRQDVRREEAARFARLQEKVLAKVAARFRSAEQAIHGAKAVVESLGEVSPAQWERYVNSVWPFFDRGVVGLGLVRRVRHDDIEDLGARLRAGGRTSSRPDRRVDRTLFW